MSAAGPTSASLRVRRTLRPVQRRWEVLRATGRLRPSRIELQPSGHAIHVDPSDERGWRLVLGLGRGHQPALLALWSRALSELAPTLVIDVGVNYGEFVFSGTYPADCRIVGIEANPALLTWIERSRREHPQAGRIEVHQVLAGAQDGPDTTLHVDPAWSGSASIALDRTRSGAAPRAVTVPVRALDSLLGATGSGPLVFKIDVEGAEEQVLAGMAQLRGRHRPQVGLVEFDPMQLRRAGSDPGVVLELARGDGVVRAVDHTGGLHDVEAVPDSAVDLLVADDVATLDAVLGHPR